MRADEWVREAERESKLVDALYKARHLIATDSINCDLINIALVADDGREFYGERSDYNQARRSEFVDAAVLSRLCQFFPVGCSPATLRGLDCSRGHQFVPERERLLCFDNSGGWQLLCDLLGGPRTGWKAVDDRQVFDVGRMKGCYRTQ
ncbi:hypothetical protein PQR66_24590 [Paraburkholderia agricolaris]|uniref:Uncharacterized protein n=1 Tax=Paraburkholderia agricolaris TaxID=2152888 RepID=A0ABW8ZTA9_9BURK